MCGLKSESAQKKLLTEADLAFAKAIEIAEGMEAAEASTQQFNRDSAPTVHYVHQPCNYCGRSNHASTDCCYKGAMCHFCKKRGHLASICRAKKQNQGAVAFSKAPPRGSKTQFRKFKSKWMKVKDEDTPLLPPECC